MMEKIDFQQIYEKHESYEKRRIDGQYREDYLEDIDCWKNKYLLKVLPENQKFNKILDIGCGTGDLIAKFPLNIDFSNRYGLDISDKNIKFAQKKYPEVNWICGTIDDLNSDMDYSLIILSDILEHVEDDIELLKKSSCLSKYLLVNIPMEKCYSTRNREYGPNDIAGHLRSYDYFDVLKLIKKANLKIKRYIVKYISKESFWQKRFSRDYFSKYNFNQTLIRLPVFIYKILRFKLAFKLYPSNFFGFLEKNNI
ncbi:MAG: class I SAM-dependent methyltransferase [Candidatus Thorarchaeota archaeon]